MINNTELIYELAKTVSELEIVLRFLLGFIILNIYLVIKKIFRDE